MRISIALGLLGTIVAVPAAPAAADVPDGFVGDPSPADGRPRSSYIKQPISGVVALPHGGAPTIFYLNKNGGTYRPGNNDARTNYSSIVDSISTVPAWNVSSSGWNQVVECMRDMFSRWNVTITDVDPGNVAHFELVIAGSPQDIGMQSGVGGVSPYTYDCSVIPNSIVYTFAEVYGSDYQAICETSAQEVAHSFGLDHEYLCEDPMTYLYNCGDKSFQDIDAPCGEYSARECSCGGNTQNSVEWLNERLGIASGNQPPTVSITAPGDGATVAPGFAVSASASDDASVARVEFRVDGALAQTDTSAPYGFNTAGSLADGAHTVEARAYDGAGASATDSVTVTVSSGGGGTTPDAGPGGGDTPDADPGPGGGGDTPDAGSGGGGAGGDDEGGGSDDGYIAGGCAAGGGAGGLLALALAALLTLRRRRRVREP